MSSVTSLVRRATALGAIALSTALAGCVAYPSYYHPSAYDQGGDYYYGDDYYANDYYGGYYGYYGYHSLFWPSYAWYGPGYWPGYYYGVSFAPWFSFGYYDYDWDDHHHGHHGHGGNHHYSPYRNSWGDNQAYYGGGDWRHGDRDQYSGYRFGSARNEAERIANSEAMANKDPRTGATPAAAGSGQRGNWSRGIDYGDRNDEAALQARQSQRDAAWGDGNPQNYSRYRGDGNPPGRAAPDWRSRAGTAPAPAAREIDAHALGSTGRPGAHYSRGRAVYDADAQSQGRDPTMRYETPTPRSADPRYQATPRHATPEAVQPQGQGMRGEGRPASAQLRSFDAPSHAPSPSPSPSPSPRSSGGESHGRSDSGGGERWSREPD